MNKQEGLFESICKSTMHAIIIVDSSGVIQLYNESSAKLFQYSNKEVIGSNFAKIIPTFNDILLSRNNKGVFNTDLNVIAIQKDGSKINIFLSMIEFTKDKNKYYLYIMHEINKSCNYELLIYSIMQEIFLLFKLTIGYFDQYNTKEKIDELAIIDPLTKLYNRSYFEKYFSNVLDEYHNTGRKFCVLIIDLKNFSRVNDIYGHLCGDEVLQKFSKLLLSLIKKNDFVARIGGDEFAVILLDIKKYEYAQSVARRIINKSSLPYIVKDEKIQCSLNIGIVGYPVSGVTKEQLMKRADFSLYHAKENRNQWAFFSKLFEEKYLRNATLESSIDEGFQKNQFYCLYHPQININDGSVYGVEALLRWSHPILGEILPTEFIPIIENIGKAEMLNSYIIKKVLQQNSLINMNKSIHISINISPKVDNFSKHIKNLLLIIEKYRTNNIKYCLEMTESDFENSNYNDATYLRNALILLKEHGVDFAIDDFGVKHSSINRLISYEFNTIKIDKIFTQKLDDKDNKSTKSVIKAILSLSADLGFTVIAEGAETKAQIDILNTLGCKIVQGFYYYEPLSLDNFLNIL